MLNKDTREVLRTLTSISEKFILETPKTTITDENKQLICAIDLESLGENFEEPIGIADMNRFINAVELISDPEITIKDRIINIKNNKSSINYLSSSLLSMEKVDYKIVDTTKKANSVLDFELTKETLDTIKKTISVFKSFDTVLIDKKEDSLQISVGLDSSFNTNSDDFSINIDDYKDSDIKKEFKIKLPIQSFLMIPSIDYNVSIKYNEKKGSYRVFLNSGELIEIVMSIIK